jgi:translation initiation factor IF-2
MAEKVRVFKLAKEFSVENEVMVAKIQNLGFQVRNYMSGLELEDAQRVRRLLEKERAENTVEERIRPTVVRRRTKTAAAAAKPSRTKPSKTAVAAEAAGTAEAAAPAKKRTSKKGAAATEPAATAAEIAAGEALTGEAAGADARRAAEGGDFERKPEFVEVPELDSEANAEAAAAGAPAAAPAAQEEQQTGSRPLSLRPASEAPIVRRTVQLPTEEESDDGKRGKGAPQRRREVEGRDMVAPRSVVGSGKFGAAPARKRRMTPGKKGKKTEITTPKASKRVIRVEGQITLQELAKRMSVKSTELLMKLIAGGMAGININSTLDIDTAKLMAEEFGYEVEDIEVGEEEMLSQTRAEETDEEKKQRIVRAPVVTMMGHVDHGKTSLLDAIRKSDVAAGEAGGITQHIGAYRVKTAYGDIAFIDTPGHAAFTAMRARGANVTDIVILVIAADDGVMPQTVEAINHARAASCPIIIAVNKCDLPGANIDRARRQLMEHNLVPEELGGESIFVDVSAKTKQGLDKLLEMISLQAEMLELTANPKRPGAGAVLEAYLDRGRGPVANLLVQEGTLKTGDVIVAGSTWGKIRLMTDERGRKINEAGPSTPVEVLGLSAVPNAGDAFDAAADMKVAEKVASTRAEKSRMNIAAPSRPSLESLYQQMQESEQAEIKLIIKSDVQGTMEALRDSLLKLTNEKVKVTIVHASVGGITESDVLLASTSGSIIIGFNVRPAGKARQLAEEQGIDIKIFAIIYEVIDAVRAAMIGKLTPKTELEMIGTAEVRNTFTIPKIGTIAGSYVTEGKVVRTARTRLVRDAVQVWEGRLSSLKRFKDDAREVATGFECGICLDGCNDIRVGDVLEFYVEKQVEVTMP